MDDLLPSPTGQVIEASYPFWDQIHTYLKSIKWVTGEGNWKSLQTPRCIVLRGHCTQPSCLKFTILQEAEAMSIELLN